MSRHSSDSSRSSSQAAPLLQRAPPRLAFFGDPHGGLRVHMSADNPAIQTPIYVAKNYANGTCDQCAEADTLRDLSGYLCTRCDVHAQSRGWSP